MNGRILMRTNVDPSTALSAFETISPDDKSGLGSTMDLDATVDPKHSDKTWLNFALASILTLAPVTVVGPIDVFGRRKGSESATVYDWLEVDDFAEEGFVFPGGLIVPNMERTILFRKVLRLEKLEKRQPVLSF
jgi:hypothetical protein